MSQQDPRIIELDADPESTPRTSAMILIGFAVLGAAFILVGAVFTDNDDPYYNLGSWESNDEPRKDAAFYMIPSLVRDDDAKKAEQKALEPIEERAKPKRATTAPGYKPGDAARPGQPPKPDPGVPRKVVTEGETVLPDARRDLGGTVVPGAAKGPGER